MFDGVEGMGTAEVEAKGIVKVSNARSALPFPPKASEKSSM